MNICIHGININLFKLFSVFKKSTDENENFLWNKEAECGSGPSKCQKNSLKMYDRRKFEQIVKSEGIETRKVICYLLLVCESIF